MMVQIEAGSFAKWMYILDMYKLLRINPYQMG